MHDATREEKDRAVLVALDLPGRPADLRELAALVETAGGEVVGELTQQRGTPDNALYLGTGKAEELRGLALATDATVVIVDDELSPRQIRNLEDKIDLKVIDRTQLILEIFAQRAETHEGRIQVEIALLNYSLPRLTGKGAEMSRLGASTPGARTRGAGESKLELERRNIRNRIGQLRAEAKEVSKHRQLLRAGRTRRGYPLVALVGYTNAGKSSLLNALTEAAAFEADMLFATLDPTTRVLALPDGREVALTDTVGFISRLPHMLVQAFHATLEEVQEADLLVHVVDASNPEMLQQMASVAEVLRELNCQDKPQVIAYNKIDLIENKEAFLPEQLRGPYALVSAKHGTGLDQLCHVISSLLPNTPRRVTYLLPYDRGDAAAWLHREGEVSEQQYEELGTRITVDLPETAIQQAAKLFSIRPLGERPGGHDDEQ
ncbi:MAG: GTPase HflX [Bacillota bacterium]